MTALLLLLFNCKYKMFCRFFNFSVDVYAEPLLIFHKGCLFGPFSGRLKLSIASIDKFWLRKIFIGTVCVCVCWGRLRREGRRLIMHTKQRLAWVWLYLYFTGGKRRRRKEADWLVGLGIYACMVRDGWLSRLLIASFACLVVGRTVGDAFSAPTSVFPLLIKRVILNI